MTIRGNPRVKSNDARVYFVRGMVYAKQGKKAEAISDLERYIALANNPRLITIANDALETLR
jgi:regulator of sirC expression with transglutaminase-like and TPR domain